MLFKYTPSRMVWPANFLVLIKALVQIREHTFLWLFLLLIYFRQAVISFVSTMLEYF